MTLPQRSGIPNPQKERTLNDYGSSCYVLLINDSAGTLNIDSDTNDFIAKEIDNLSGYQRQGVTASISIENDIVIASFTKASFSFSDTATFTHAIFIKGGTSNRGSTQGEVFWFHPVNGGNVLIRDSSTGPYEYTLKLSYDLVIN